MSKILLHLKNNNGDEYIEKLVLIVIAFSIGASLLIIMSKGFQEEGVVSKWIGTVMGNALTGEKIA